MNGLHFGIWLATAVVAIFVLGIPAAMSRSQNVKLALCLLLGFVWATPCFAVFIHWLLSGTSLAFYTSATNRHPQTAGMRAFLALFLGTVVVYASGSLASKPKTSTSARSSAHGSPESKIRE